MSRSGHAAYITLNWDFGLMLFYGLHHSLRQGQGFDNPTAGDFSSPLSCLLSFSRQLNLQESQPCLGVQHLWRALETRQKSQGEFLPWPRIVCRKTLCYALTMMVKVSPTTWTRFGSSSHRNTCKASYWEMCVLQTLGSTESTKLVHQECLWTDSIFQKIVILILIKKKRVLFHLPKKKWQHIAYFWSQQITNVYISNFQNNKDVCNVKASP